MKTRIIFLLSMILFIGSCDKSPAEEVKEFPYSLDGTKWVSVGEPSTYTIEFEDVAPEDGKPYPIYGTKVIMKWRDSKGCYYLQHEGVYLFPNLTLRYKQEIYENGELGELKRINDRNFRVDEERLYLIAEDGSWIFVLEE